MTLSLVEPVMNEQQKYPPQADYHPFLNAPRAKAAGVLSGASTLLRFPSWREKVALVSLRPDFEADGLRHGAHPCFGAKTAPHSPVGAPVHVRPASAPPHFPRE